MMKNKVLIRLFVPELDYTFDVFIPINEIIWKVKKLLAKSVSDLTGGVLDISADYTLINKLTSEAYDNNSVVANTNIRNATELILLSVKENHIDIIGLKPESGPTELAQNTITNQRDLPQQEIILNPTFIPPQI